MNAWLVQLKREFWEHNSSFVITPLVIAVLIVIAGCYVVTMYASPDSEIGMELFGQVYQYDYDYGDDGEEEDGEAIDFSGPAETVTGTTPVDDDRVEYVIDFTRGELTVAEDARTDVTLPVYRQQVITMGLHGIHTLFMTIFAFVLLSYLLGCLHTDCKDRSVLFWKSLPVSEHRNVAVKLLVAVLVVPLLVTVLSWAVQLCYLALTMIFIYRIDADPWEVVWSQADILRAFFEQLKYVLWMGAWFLPFDAWWLFASALAKRSPFLVATIPFVVIITLEKLLFGASFTGSLLLMHMQTGLSQLGNIMGDEMMDITSPRSINLFLNNTEMLAGFVIAGLLFPATVWLRNHRFEI